jgi:iron complex transport system substrate-binding protein
VRLYRSPRRGIAALLALLALGPGPSRAQPSRVISLNLCTDQLLLALADPGAIASVTYLARDCTISAHCREAARCRSTMEQPRK